MAGGSRMSAPHPLNQAVIAQALHDLRNGQLRRCKAMGFGEEELVLIEWAPDAASLTISNAQRLPAKETRSEEHTSELQSLMRISYAVFCLTKKKSLQHKAISRYIYADIIQNTHNSHID